MDCPLREQLIQSELARIDADIVCLQEIQIDVWDVFMKGLDDRYEGILQNVTNDHPVTNAILLRKDKFRVAKQESRSRALILVLEQQCNTGDNPYESSETGCQPLYLANVHLQAGIDDDETRVCQLKSLLKRLAFHSKGNETPSKSSKAVSGKNQKELPPAVVIAGDMNMLPTNPVYRWLSHKEHETANSTSATQQAPKVHMRDSGTGLELSNLKFPARGKHVELLPLADVYRYLPPVLLLGGSDQHHQKLPAMQEEEDGRPVLMTYCGGSVLDYIWTTTTAAFDSTTSLHSIDISKTMVFHPQAFEGERQQWPSSDHPSDHLPIGFEFSWH